MKIEDFTSVESIGKHQLNDIVWGVFNQRTIVFSTTKMWHSLSRNYSNMADLLIGEKKFTHAIDYIFATSFIQTSGMDDNNELKAILTDFGPKKIRFLDNGMPDIYCLEIWNSTVTVPFLKIQKELNLDWQEIKAMFFSSPIVDSLDKLLPFKYFEKAEAFEIFSSAIEAGGKNGIFTLSELNEKIPYNKPNEHCSKYFYASVENKINRKLS